VAFAGRQAVKQPQSPTNGVNINTISYAPQNIRLDQYMLSRRLYLMKAGPTSDPDRNLQEELFYDWATNPDNEVAGRCNMDPLMVQYGYVPCTDDCSPPTGANTLCVKTPFQPAPEPAAACLPSWTPCASGVDVCCSGACEWGSCGLPQPRAEGFACSDSSQCASPLSCLQGDWPVTTCSLAPGGISGTIRLNGIGLENVQVSANQMSGIPYNAMTDSSGNYSVVGLASGQYAVVPFLSGYTFDPPQATITVQDAIVTGVNFAAIVIPMYEISGTVTVDGVGYAYPYVNIVAGPQNFQTVGDPSGNYSAMVPNGDYTIQVSAPYGYAVDPQTRMVTINGAGASGQDFTFIAIPRYTISGIITLNGNGLANVSVVATGVNWSGSATTGDDGQYVISTMEDEYTVEPELFGYTFSPTVRSVSLHANISGVNFTATAIPMYDISGRVTFEGNGLFNAQLTLKDAQETDIANVSTDPLGNFSFTNVLDGAYVITGSLCGYSLAPLPVTVSGGNITGLLIVAASAPNYSVSGAVTSNGVGVPVNVSLSGPFSGYIATSTWPPNGSYSFTCLPMPGFYTITPSTDFWQTQYDFSPPSVTVELTESTSSVMQNFTATPQ
jgi:hypothetical protein